MDHLETVDLTPYTSVTKEAEEDSKDSQTVEQIKQKLEKTAKGRFNGLRGLHGELTIEEVLQWASNRSANVKNSHYWQDAVCKIFQAHQTAFRRPTIDIDRFLTQYAMMIRELNILVSRQAQRIDTHTQLRRELQKQVDIWEYAADDPNIRSSVERKLKIEVVKATRLPAKHPYVQLVCGPRVLAQTDVAWKWESMEPFWDQQ
eukprot:GILK01006141.1.p1 GENE.GILK01006141.1~~GILK01006141.1.p1  ORF type:complete len:203 (+),score=29.03 GILK01006141.1:87-695(+)